MSTLSKIRNNIGLVIVLIVISLAAFILTDFFTGKTRGMGSTNNVAGEVAGTEIPVTEINDRVELYSRGSQEQSKEQMDELERQVWQEIVQEVINNEEYNSIGMGVSDQEESMLYFGPITNQYIYQFPWFRDSLGQFNPDVVRMRFQQADQIDINRPNSEMELNFKLDMLNLKKFLITNRLVTKWQAMVNGSALVSDNEVRKANVDQQKRVDITYVTVPFASILDDQVTVGDNDYQDYYNSIKEVFKRENEQVSVKYTAFPVSPSALDSADARVEIDEYRDGFLEAEDAFQYAFLSSNAPNIDTSMQSFVSMPQALRGVSKTDSIVGPVMGQNGYELLRVVNSMEGENAVVNARHIVVQIKGNTAQDSVDARQAAYDIRRQVNADPASFAQLVLEKSDDFQSKASAGEMGWVDPAAYGPDFQKDVTEAAIGSFIVTNSPRGYHVIQVQDRSKMLYSFARLSRTIGISSATDDSVSKRASQYASRVLAGENMDSILTEFPEAITATSPAMDASAYQLRGVKDGRPVISWAFTQEAGATSEDLIKTEDAFVVARVVTKGGNDYVPMVEVRDQLTTAVRQMVKGRQIKAKLAGLGGDLPGMVAGYGEGATSGTAPGLTFSSGSIPGLGNEPKVVGRALGMTQGQVSEPIIGTNGVYVIKVDKITEAPDLQDNDINIRRQAMLQAKQGQVYQNLTNGMREAAKIKDTRYLFPSL